METLSASLNLPPLPPRRSSISGRFKPTVNATATNLSKPPSSSSSSHHKNLTFPRGISLSLPNVKPSRAPQPPPSPPPPVHEKAASGFAAALVSVCQSKNCLGRTQEDVRRLMAFLVGEDKNRNNNHNNKVLVNEVVERGKFGKHLKGLVKMLVTRGKSEILFDVLMEFERIYSELVVTKLVWVT
ncbi:unnamed protein product [Eruca vesicaria subsp. sativa]|uniref:Uncharacterized protein n=1 Tax=Eruca vesicaria subsp. sativa TaxID=29727 RepID=A0ABC8M325_ERUVS|nr:unnamed protein product [Eruca vesicaria subsp. sativa]